MKYTITRREALALISSSILVSSLSSAEENQRFRTRGVVLYSGDLTFRDWPERASRAGITTIGLHAEAIWMYSWIS